MVSVTSPSTAQGKNQDHDSIYGILITNAMSYRNIPFQSVYYLLRQWLRVYDRSRLCVCLSAVSQLNCLTMTIPAWV